MSDVLEVVDKKGRVIGQEPRTKIHQQGLLHREVHVWLFTPGGELIFQHRAEDKETYPDMLDASVGGHVEIGDDWETSAIKELEEETGIQAKPHQLIFIDQVHTDTHERATGMRNNALRRVYALRYDGKIKDLRVEEGKSLGFEAWPFNKLPNLSDDEKRRFIPLVLNAQHLAIMKKIESLI